MRQCAGLQFRFLLEQPQQELVALQLLRSYKSAIDPARQAMMLSVAALWRSLSGQGDGRALSQPWVMGSIFPAGSPCAGPESHWRSGRRRLRRPRWRLAPMARDTPRWRWNAPAAGGRGDPSASPRYGGGGVHLHPQPRWPARRLLRHPSLRLRPAGGAGDAPLALSGSPTPEVIQGAP